MTTTWPAPITLTGHYATLEPLSLAHHDALLDAVKDGELWRVPYSIIPTPDNMRDEILRFLDLQSKGLMCPFAVISNATKRAVGVTTYFQIDSINKRLDIGWTWYAKSYQKTALNTECKLLLLTHAFEQLNGIYVGFRADYLNQPSRQAIERLGAKLEGVIRNYSVLPNGCIRDMCFYSILSNEWPMVKEHIKWLLNKPR